jgi:GNAT superfamily N-acetyltransferase
MSATEHSDTEPPHDNLLQATELGDAEALVREAGWNQLDADWRIFLELGAVYAVRNSERQVIATAATLPYSGGTGWIGMVLVKSNYRRRGIGARLLRRCVEDLEGRRLAPMLDATPAGRALYVGLGFWDAWGFQRYSASAPRREDIAPLTPDGLTIRSLDDDQWAELCRYDARVFGADRSAMLARLRGRAPGAQLAAWRGDRMIGFVLGRDGRSATQLGPVAAEDEGAAQALLGVALNNVQGPIYVDLLDDKSALRRRLTVLGFTPQRKFTRMVHGGFTVQTGDLARTMAIAGPELG